MQGTDDQTEKEVVLQGWPRSARKTFRLDLRLPRETERGEGTAF